MRTRWISLAVVVVLLWSSLFLLAAEPPQEAHAPDAKEWELAVKGAYSSEKVKSLARDASAAAEFSLRFQTETLARERMVVDALRMNPSDEIAVLLIRSLEFVRISPETMAEMCNRLGTLDKSVTYKAPAGASPNLRVTLNWMEKRSRFTDSPAYEVLFLQGQLAVPILKDRLPKLASDSLAFGNAVHLLTELMGAEEVKRWLSAQEAGISSEQRTEALKIAVTSLEGNKP